MGRRDFPTLRRSYSSFTDTVIMRPNADGWPAPMIVGRTIGVDTISHGVLTAVRLPDQRVFQSARHEVLGSHG